MAQPKTLRNVDPFRGLSEAVLTELEQASSFRTYPAQTYIFKQQDAPTGYLYLVSSGLIEIFVLTPGGVEMVVDYRKAGSFFGGTPIFTDEAYTAGARAAKETDCWLIPATLLTRISSQHPQIAEFFTRAAFSRVRNLYADMIREHSDHALTGLDAYPFQKRLSEIMTAPPPSCSADTPARVVAGEMARLGIGAMLVREGNNPVAGIITEHDLVNRLLARVSTDCETARAAEVMTPHPLTMDVTRYMYEATSFMIRNGIRHLPLVDQGEVLGMVTLAELLKFRSHKAMLLIGNVRDATTVGELAGIKQEIVRVARALLQESRSPLEIMEVLSYIHHCILQRGFELTLAGLRQAGQEPPELRFCLLLLGSGGRREMLLDPDQDCALVYEDFPDQRRPEVERFFVPLTEQLADTWAAIGYPRCKGQVMACNPLWRGRLQDWKQRIVDWVKTPEPQQVRYSNNFFDFMPLVGDVKLAQVLRAFAHQQIHEFPLFLYHLMQLDFRHKVPLGLLGRFILDRNPEHKGTLSVKQAGSLFIVDCIRMFLLEQQQHAVTTIDRLDQLVHLGAFSAESAEHIRTAYEALNFLRLRHEIEQLEQGLPPSHHLDPYALPKNEQDLLREAFRVASKLQDSARRHFNVG